MLGVPGAGKGTQAQRIAQLLKIPHISTGDIFRHHIKNMSVLGIKAKEYIDRGMLVPDDVTVELVKDRISKKDCSNGFILDGFPRTIPQGEFLGEVLKEMGLTIDKVLNIHVEDEVIIQRISGRRVCPKCGASYHLQNMLPVKDGICDTCNVELVLREDDTEETVKKRLATYYKETEPLVGFYLKTGKLVTIEGKEKIADTTEEILKALGVK